MGGDRVTFYRENVKEAKFDQIGILGDVNATSASKSGNSGRSAQRFTEPAGIPRFCSFTSSPTSAMKAWWSFPPSFFFS